MALSFQVRIRPVRIRYTAQWSFPYITEGYLEAKEYLKDLSEDGYTIVALANSLLEKEELNQKMIYFNS